ncbi:enoyl-CoA hydratase/isomerase family protein [Burkholderia diffusa]|uniref:enoyl-CoA hydratase/isomerase family protein n=1 Tax=Burkholderia diffusa TaxID=488732 RepID=UPI00157BB094|nr:enoyl-CoA hydratase-related protein [Burkholderia diffusa]NTY41591.1 hypothetical protein [Burkholderia diffusa]
MHNEFIYIAIDGAVAIVMIDRPDASNALSDAVREQLLAALDVVEQSAAVRAIVLTARGDKVFAAGSDIREMRDMDARDSVALSESAHRLNNRIAALKKPVVCAVNGWCLGGGLELALACDIRVAAEHARFGFPEGKLGIMPGTGGIPRLVRTIGGGAARHLLLTGEPISASRAYEIGLVTVVVHKDALVSEAKTLAERMTALGPVSLEMIKRTIDVAQSSTLDEGIRFETESCAECFSTDDKVEGMTAFIEKRTALFGGH